MARHRSFLSDYSNEAVHLCSIFSPNSGNAVQTQVPQEMCCQRQLLVFRALGLLSGYPASVQVCAQTPLFLPVNTVDGTNRL